MAEISEFDLENAWSLSRVSQNFWNYGPGFSELWVKNFRIKSYFDWVKNFRTGKMVRNV